MITGLPTLELEADSECNTYYITFFNLPRPATATATNTTTATA